MSFQYLRDSNFLPTSLPNGGFPIFLNDVYNLQNYEYQNSNREFNGVLSGCLVDTLNTTTKTLTLTDGIIQIDGIQVFIPSASYEYPFAFTITGSTVNRTFNDSSQKTIGIDYSVVVRTSFSYNALSGETTFAYPNDYTTGTTVSEIYFDPFTCQRLENYQKWKQMFDGESVMVARFASNTIDLTETGNAYTGTKVSKFITTRHKISPEIFYKRVMGQNKAGFKTIYYQDGDETCLFGGRPYDSVVQEFLGTNTKELSGVNITNHKHDTSITSGVHHHQILGKMNTDINPLGSYTYPVFALFNSATDIVGYTEYANLTISGYTSNGYTMNGTALTEPGTAFTQNQSSATFDVIEKTTMPYKFWRNF